MEFFVSYTFIAITLVLIVISVVLGLENMIKIVLGNYILGTISLALMQSIDLLISFLSSHTAGIFLGISYTTLGSFFAAAKATIVLLIYFVLLFVVYKKSQITVRMPSDDSLQRVLYVFLVPLAASSMLLTLWIVLSGLGLSQDIILSFVGQGLDIQTIGRIVHMLPVRVVLHGFCTMLITSELRMTIQTDIDESPILGDDETHHI